MKLISNQITELAQKVTGDKKAIAEAIAEELVFMRGTLADLKAEIKANGPTELYTNGRQQCLRESPAMKAYTGLIPRYSALFKQLADLLPEEAEAKSSVAEFMREF